MTKLDYGNATLTGLPAYQYRRLQSVLNAAARLIYRRRPCHVALTGRCTGWSRRSLQVGSDILPVPSWFGTGLPRSERPSCSWLGPSSRTIVVAWWRHHSDNQTGDCWRSCFHRCCSLLWNSLPPDILDPHKLWLFSVTVQKLTFSLNVFPHNCTPTLLL